MRPRNGGGMLPRPSATRKWGIRIAIVLLGFEIVYLVAGNVLLRTGMLLELINTKPEKDQISWTSAVTYIPGFATVKGFELRSQTANNQVYLRVAEANARISLLGLIFKTIHISGIDARDVDFRYRERLDRPPKANHKGKPHEAPKDVEYWPEIPGLSNPPDPRPEDLYSQKKKKNPWTIKITGAEVAGPIKVALADLRIEGEGHVGGGVTVEPSKSITIHRGKLGLTSVSVTYGPKEVTDNLTIDADMHINSFPAKGAKAKDVLGGISGEISMAGQLSKRAAVRHTITPGISAFGAGKINAHLELEDGVVQAGSQYTLESEAFQLRIMGLDATGSATVSGSTTENGRSDVTTCRIAFGKFEFVNPEDDLVDISGTGIQLDATWDGQSLTGAVPASHVELVLPKAKIHDMSAFNGLIPEQTALSLVSGTGDVEARLVVIDRVAAGTVDLMAEDIAIESRETPLIGDLEVHANLAQGDLPAKTFDFSDTTIRLDHIIAKTLSDRKQDQLEPWFCALELEQGDVVFGKPMAVDGSLAIEMHDTRPVMVLLKQLGVGSAWLSLAPNIKNVNGTLDVDVREGLVAFDDLLFTGDGFEALGWMSVANKTTDGRLFTRFKAVKTGISIVQGKAKIHLSKPRKWFEAQPKGPES